MWGSRVTSNAHLTDYVFFVNSQKPSVMISIYLLVMIMYCLDIFYLDSKTSIWRFACQILT